MNKGTNFLSDICKYFKEKNCRVILLLRLLIDNHLATFFATTVLGKTNIRNAPFFQLSMKIPHTIITDGVGNAKVPWERYFQRLLLTIEVSDVNKNVNK